MNEVVLIGRLTRDPEEKAEGVVKYTLAVDGYEKADFIPCVCFGKQAEFAKKYLAQGKKIAVTARLKSGNYTNRDGKNISTLDVVINHQEFCESKSAQAEIPVKQEVPADGRFHPVPDIPEGIDAELPFE